MTEENALRKPTAKDIALLAVMYLSFIVAMAGLWIGLDTNPVADMHGRMVAYTVFIGGMTVGVACVWAMETKAIHRVILSFFLGCFVIAFIFQLVQTL